MGILTVFILKLHCKEISTGLDDMNYFTRTCFAPKEISRACFQGGMNPVIMLLLYELDKKCHT